MTRLRLALLASVALLLASKPALAFDFGVGLEGVGSLSVVPSQPTGVLTSGGGGLILEERFSVAVIEMTIWEDIQTPMQIQQTDGQPSSYVPINLGFRLGLGSPLIKPYVGILINDSLLTQSGTLHQEAAALNLKLNSNIPGIGGDLGADIGFAFLRFGLEIRGYTTLSSVESGGSSFAPFILQGLASARFSF